MRLQGRELKLEMQGADVRLLQFELSLLGFDIPGDETLKNFFGEVTQRAVIRFQREFNLEPTGVVDERTARLINRVISERVSVEKALDRLAELLAAFHEQLAVLGRNNAALRREAGRLKETLDALNAAHEQLKTEAAASAGRVAELERALAEAAARIRELEARLGETQTDRLIVRGRIVSDAQAGLPELRVIAVDKNIGQDFILGETISGARGEYEIVYEAAALRERGKGRADLQIQVFAPRAGDAPLAVSEVRYDAASPATIDVQVPAGRLPRDAEYTRLSGAVRPLVRDSLAALKEDDERQDITYLANKTGWDARMVAMAALAEQFSAQSDIAPEFYYALFRAGLPANPDVLGRVTPETAATLWQRAVEQDIIPRELADRIPEAVERFTTQSIRRLLEAPAAVGVSALDDLLTVSLGDNVGQKERFTRLYYEHRDDLDSFWQSVGQEFGDTTVRRLQLDGQLGLLTVNNAALIQRLHQAADLDTPLDLVGQGLYQPDRWGNLLAGDVAIPDEIPGDTPEAKRANYASVMANQLRLSYPTAVVADMVNRDLIPVHADQQVKTAVAQFLGEHQGKFELGVQPVEQYVKQQNLALDDATLGAIKRLQRVYQFSPSDGAMATLLQHNIDSAYAAIQYTEQEFVQLFAGDLGGETIAHVTYAKAHQVHYTVLNLMTTYLVQQSAPPLYALASGEPEDADDTGVLANPTLEGLFGEMDYCACEHCRSVLSPAAYLVDLLQFIDLRRFNGAGVELPPSYEKENPIDVLLSRRPDIAHLQLTCENTNTVLPYIDLVNEILEYFVANGVANGTFSLENFTGFNVEDSVAAEDLLANPQFVNEAAYAHLQSELFPLPLPFHQPLEALRRYFAHFEIPLHAALEHLRPDDGLTHAAGPNDPAYGWLDILIERLGLSRQEYAILADSTLPLQALYGEDPATVSEAALVANLSNVKAFTRAVGITYEEAIEITRTRFVNPHSRLIPKLERLGVDFAAIHAFHEGTLSEGEFRGLLPDDLDESFYGGDAAQWVQDSFASIMGLIVLSDPTGSEDICSFDQVEFRYALPDFDANRLRPSEFLKLLRFIRLWRKLGWTIEHIDRAIAALWPADQLPDAADDEAARIAKLDAGFRVLIPRLAAVLETLDALSLRAHRDLPALLALWAPIDTHGPGSLYRQMFLNPAILRQDDVFREDGFGNYLNNPAETLAAHAGALRAAFNLTENEFALILDDLNFDDTTPLSLTAISQVFRRGYLARKLRMSVRELLALQALSGLDPFAAPDPPHPATLRFVRLAQTIKESPFKISRLLYLLRHDDLTGKASPNAASVRAFAKTIRDDLRRIESEHVVQDDPTGELARAKMALVYGNGVADTFFGLINDTSTYSVGPYTHDQPALQADILAVTDRIAYDHFQKQLTFRGVMTDQMRDDLQNAASAADPFRAAVQALYDAARAQFQAFFERFPDLEALYTAFAASPAPLEARMSALLADFLPALRSRLKRQGVRQIVSGQIGTELALTDALLEQPDLLHAATGPGDPLIADFLNLEVAGASVDYFFADAAAGPPDLSSEAAPGIDYGPGKDTLPPNPAGGGAAISGVWRCYLEAPDSGFYNLIVESEDGADIALALDGAPVTLIGAGGVWQNQNPIELAAGRLVRLELTAQHISTRLALKWESKGLARESIPARYLAPALFVDRFAAAYIRLLKALSIVEEFDLSAAEITVLGVHPDYHIAGAGWLNALPVAPLADGGIGPALLAGFGAVLDYNRLKTDLKLRDESLADLLRNPAAVTEDGDSLLNRATGWAGDDVAALLAHFGLALDDLRHLEHLLRLKRAFDIIKPVGVPASTLLANTTNAATAAIVRTLQAALRARYDARAWLNVIQPINDALRASQRDALVAFVLRRLKGAAATQHIDTPNKLFEYFLIDVEMDPCMKTSRIKQAISTVQLFIQRCLLNLEPEVASSSIKAKQWAWMKRYRVWEANRKVFLFPENWLEPELRDNKSSFFKDLEGELLQSDITDDAAAVALLHYLEKLDQVAKLEICGIYLLENERSTTADDVVHVIARSSGAKRTYYYRRLEGGAWLPWEKVGVDIEDNPIVPVVWKGRLFLFWVSIRQEVPPGQSSLVSNSSKQLTELKGSDLSGSTKVRATATLYWSEYYNGKWQPPKTSDINRPQIVAEYNPATASFDRSQLTLYTSTGQDGALFVDVTYIPQSQRTKRFKLYNTHSLPVLPGDETMEGGGLDLMIMWLAQGRTFSAGNGAFTIEYFDPFSIQTTDWSFSRQVLGRALAYQVIEPRHPLSDIFQAPFFFQDRRHVFYVRSAMSTTPVWGYVDFGVQVAPPILAIPDVPPLTVKPDPWDLVLPEELIFPPIRFAPGVVDPNPVEHFLNQNATINQAIATAGAIRYGDRIIGPGGSIAFDAVAGLNR